MDFGLNPCNTTTSMDWLKPCTTTTSMDWCSDNLVFDRFTSLPDELLIRILSLLPTKDAAATCVLSKRMTPIFPWITTLDFDDFPISHCLKGAYALERFPTFVAFVDNVLRANQSQHLTRFRLAFGVDYNTSPCRYCQYLEPFENGCFPDLKFTQINAWITFPLTRCGLKELDLRFQMKKRGHAQLPLEIFTCETLEVLKIDVNLDLDQTSTMPSFRLPNLRILHLWVAFISEDCFLTRLVPSCPLLEYLNVEAHWNLSNRTNISSPSLRRLELNVTKGELENNDDFVLIHTPNLEYLKYVDSLALQYFIPNMNRLVKAYIYITFHLEMEESDAFQNMLSLLETLSNVQDLTLDGACALVLSFVEIKDPLPVFHNLKFLELKHCCDDWGESLLAFLNCSPVLETLVFPLGYSRDNLSEIWTTELAIIPSSCRYHLKRIVINFFQATEREMNMTQFLLRHALVLEELVVFRCESAIVDLTAIESTLQNFPRAVTCSIQVQEIA